MAARGFVTLTFDVGTDIQEAKLDVINNLNQAPPRPADAVEPRVFAGGGQQAPPAASLLIRVLPHNPDKELANYQKLIEEHVEPRLASIPGVSQVNLMGEQPREMQITFDAYRAAALGIGIDLAKKLTLGFKGRVSDRDPRAQHAEEGDDDVDGTVQEGG